MSLYPRATFVMEQHLGHLTYCNNLRAAVDDDSRIDPTWVPVDYTVPTGWPSMLDALRQRIDGTPSGWYQVARGLGTGNADVAFFNTQVPAVLGFLQTWRLPYLVATDITPRQYDRMADLYDHTPDSPGPISAAKHALTKRTFAQAAKVVCWSSWCARSVVEEYGVPDSDVEVIAPGIDLEFWKPGPERNDDGMLRILFVGGHLERKGGPFVIDAFSQLPEGSAELHLVTRSSYEPTRSDIIVHQNMQPNTPELLDLYQRCDVFVLPSQAEAFGIAAAEATACGLPVVSSRSGGLTDIVIDGETGYALPDVTTDAIADRLRFLAEAPDLRAEMGRSGRQRAERLFDAKRNGAHIVDLLVEHAAGAS